MSLETLQDLFVNELKDMYNAENQIVKALPRLAKAAESAELRNAFEKHLRETETQVQRLERICERLGERPTGKRCKGMEGLIEEGKDILEDKGEEAVRDAALIAAAQKVEHYEIASYGCLITYAGLLGDQDAAKLLKQTLAEEEAADKKLTELGEGGINEAAVAAGARREDDVD